MMMNREGNMINIKNQLQQRRLAMISAAQRSKFIRPMAYLILLLLSYTFGYLSSSLSTSSSTLPPPPPPLLPAASTMLLESPTSNQPTTTTTTITTTVDVSDISSGGSSPPYDGDHYRFGTRCADPVSSKLVRQTILDRVYNGTSPYDGFPPAYISSLLRSKRIKGWGSTGAVFENLIRRVKPRTIIEVGTFLGASATHMAELTRELGLKTQILCVDDFRGWPGFRDQVKDIKMVNGDVMLLYQFMQNVVHLNSTEMVLPVPFSSGSALLKLCEWGVMGDLIEVDAGHDFHSAWSDINLAYKILRPGGVIFGHDYFTAADNRGVRRAVNLFARAKGLRVQVDGQHWVIDSV